MANDDERIALFLDYENLAIGARDGLGVSPFEFAPIADALAERGRVVARRAYADWSGFGDDRRVLARAQVELIEIPQHVGGSRKNAADIKLAVDAIELAYERPFVTTFAIGTGDSDFTPLVHKLRELDKRVIGIGVQSSTSALLPPACDEFLFYDRLPGVEPGQPARRGRGPRSAAVRLGEAAGGEAPERGSGTAGGLVEDAADDSTRDTSGDIAADTGTDTSTDTSTDTAEDTVRAADDRDVSALVTQTLAGLQRHTDGPVLASRLKRAILRKDPTFDEADHGFRGFGELLRHLERQRVVALSAGSAQGDPEVSFPAEQPAEDGAFRLLVDVVRELRDHGGTPQLSGLKNKLRKRTADFTEKRYGFNSFLAFVKAARARGMIDMSWDDGLDDYRLSLPD